MDLFGTAGVRGDATERVTPELVLAVARAAADRADAEEVVVARDGRVTGEALAAAAAAGVESAGATALRAGRLPTPALAFASRGREGIAITASHNPPEDNGLKLFVDGVEYDAAAEREVEARVEAGVDPVAWDEWGGTERLDVLEKYRRAVREYAAGLDGGASPADLRVVVDCGNGVAALVTPQVLSALGADVVTLNANVDGRFPGRPSKPTAGTLGDLRGFVRERRDDGASVDLAVAHDGDGDRIVVLDGDGEVVHEDTVVAVLAEHYVAASEAAEPVVVTTPNASGRIDERVAERGGRVERVALGALHEGIADVRAAGDTVAFAAEPWKHVHPAFGGWIDGVVSAAVLARLVAAAGSVDALREPVTERPYRKANVDCPDERKATAMEAVAAAIPERFPDADVTTAHGVRAAFPDGSWLLVRPSGTEPYLRVYVESEDVDALLDAAVDVVRECTDSGDRI